MFAILGKFANNFEAAVSYSLGITAFSTVYILLGGIMQSYYYEIQLGTISFLYTSPVSRLQNYLSRSIFHYPNAVLSCLTSLITAWSIFKLDLSIVNWVGFLIAFCVIILSGAAFAQFCGMFVIKMREFSNTYALASGVILALTGIIIPVADFPTVVEEITKLLPITSGLLAIRDC